ncbi:hypothetical protein [Azospirillum endophyticum]
MRGRSHRRNHGAKLWGAKARNASGGVAVYGESARRPVWFGGDWQVLHGFNGFEHGLHGFLLKSLKYP